jgi:hypothetical protein
MAKRYNKYTREEELSLARMANGNHSIDVMVSTINAGREKAGKFPVNDTSVKKKLGEMPPKLFKNVSATTGRTTHKWSDPADKLLIQMYEQGHGTSDIAEALKPIMPNVTMKAVQMRTYKLRKTGVTIERKEELKPSAKGGSGLHKPKAPKADAPPNDAWPVDLAAELPSARERKTPVSPPQQQMKLTQANGGDLTHKVTILSPNGRTMTGEVTKEDAVAIIEMIAL